MGIVGPRIRKLVYRKCNGNCAYCGKTVEFKGPKGFQVDHLQPTYWNWADEQIIEKNIVRGTDDLENLMPACRRCNKWKADYDIDFFRDIIRKQFEVGILEHTGFKLLVDYGIIVLQDWDGKFYFERQQGFLAHTKRITSNIG